MPLMRIRSVEIVFEDEMSACTDTALLDRSMELILSDSDDSTKCVDDLQEKDCDDNSVTLNPDGDLSDDNSVSLTRDHPVIEEVPSSDTLQLGRPDVDDTNVPSESVTSALDDVTFSSLNISEVADSGRFTEDACSSHFETVPVLTYEDALLSNSFDAICVDNPTALKAHDVTDVRFMETEGRLFEYIDSNSDSSDNTAVCDVEFSPMQHLMPLRDAAADDADDGAVCDGSDLQYDSFIDMGKF